MRTKRTKKTKTAKLPSQKQLPGTETPKDRKLTKLALKYAEKRVARAAAGREELVAKSALIVAMKERGDVRYEDPEEDILVTLIPGKDKLKVEPLSGADEDDEDGIDAGDDMSVDRKSASAGGSNGAASE